MRTLLLACLVVGLTTLPRAAEAQCHDYGSPALRLIQEWTSSDDVTDMDVSGDLVFFAGERNSDDAPQLKILDISNLESPVVVGSASYAGSGATTLAVVGDYVLVGDETAGVVRFDVSDPANPVQAGSLEFGPFTVYEIGAYEGFAYVITGGGLRVLDLSSPTEMSVVGTSSRGGIGGIIFDDDLAYHSARGGLIVFDVSDPSVPLVLGNIVVGQPRGIAKSGSSVYLTDGEVLSVVDVSDPTSPIIVDTIDILADADDVAIQGSLAFVTGVRENLRVVDLSLPVPAVVAVGPGRGARIAVDGDVVLIPKGRDLTIVDVSDPTSIFSTTTLETRRRVEGIEVSGDLAFVAALNHGLEISDISDPTAPEIIGWVFTPEDASGVAVSGDYAYVTDGDLQVIDVSNPEAPSIVGTTSLGHQSFMVDAVGPLVCVGSNTHLWTCDASDPTQPVVLGWVGVPSGVDGLQMFGDYVYVASGSSLMIIGLSDPTDPVVVSTVPIVGARDVHLIGGQALQDLAFVASDGLSILDVSDPTAPILLSQLSTAGITRAVDVADDVAYLSGGEAGMQVIDVSDPGAPVHLGSAWHVVESSTEVVVAKGYVFSNHLGFPVHCNTAASTDHFDPVTVPRFIVSQPNPTPGPSTLVFELPRSGDFRLEMFDAGGRLVRRFAAGERSSGIHTVQWDGRDDAGAQVPNGVYWARLGWSGGSASQRLSVVR